MAAPSQPVALAGDQNFALHASWLERNTPGMLVDEGHGALLVDSGLTTDTFNVICSARFNDKSRRGNVRWLLDHFLRSKLPFSWWTGPGDSPGNVGEILEREGLRAAESELAMTVRLSNLKAEMEPTDLRIERVATPQQLRHFAEVTAEGEQQALVFYERVAEAALRPDCPIRLFVGYAGEKPVSTVELTVGEGTVGIYNVATLAEFRRRGYGTAMLLFPLLQAKAEGFVRAILQAAPEAVSIYKRVGFQAYGDVTEFKPAMR